jgi:competence protein ComEA
MSPFRPVEIKLIVVLSFLVLIGSFLTLLKRQSAITSLDLGIFTGEDYYKYQYSLPSADDTGELDSTETETSGPEAIPDDPLIDINLAGYYDLQTLPGIGPALAARIIEYRDSVGRFQRVEDLLEVDGIGPVKLKRLRGQVVLK